MIFSWGSAVSQQRERVDHKIFLCGPLHKKLRDLSKCADSREDIEKKDRN